MRVDVAIVGGGPAGLATAIEAARRGLSTVLFERQALPVDKACGEGLMPYGVKALQRMGALALIDSNARKSFLGIRYVEPSGMIAEALLKEPGLGVRRLALSNALAARAERAGARLFERTSVEGFEVRDDGVRLSTAAGSVHAQLLVGADGLHSPIRKASRLELRSEGSSRYGLRQHFRVEPWSGCVEIHLADLAEAYVTPVGPEQVGVAFLWERAPEKTAPEALLARFPHLAARLSGAQADGGARGAGPFIQRVRSPVARRVALIGDAAGYVDAITGEGLSLAFESAEALGQLLPAALEEGGSERSLQPYAKAHRRAFRRYAALAQAVLAIARRPRLRRGVIGVLARFPRTFARLLDASLPSGR